MSNLLFLGQFIATKAGKTGLTVTVDVDKYALADATRTSEVTAGAGVEGRNGLYSYLLAAADLATYQYVATFKTADATVDQQHVAALGLVVPDALVSSRVAAADYLEPDNNGIALIKNQTDLIPAAPAAVGDIPGAETVAMAVRAELGVELARVDVAVSVLSAQIAAIGAFGPGSGTGTYSDTVTDGANPLDGVRVQLSTDLLGTNRIYEAFTNALGVFTMNPDPGTYYRWLDLAGYAFTQAVQVVVA